MLNSLEKAVSRAGENSWEAVREDVQKRHPFQNDKPAVTSRTISDSRDFQKLIDERVERIDFFLRWYRTDSRAVDALEKEKITLKENLETLRSGTGDA